MPASLSSAAAISNLAPSFALRRVSIANAISMKMSIPVLQGVLKWYAGPNESKGQSA
jgi:hypothetical protein